MRRAILALLLAMPTAASAQAAPPPVQDWSNIETITVIARKPGPPLWHITKDQSDVWILATVAPMPHELRWNEDEVTKIIFGANRVYLPPEIKVGFFEASWFLLTGLHKIKQTDGHTLLGSLPPDLRTRYAAWLVKLGEGANTDEAYLPAAAALDLEHTFQSHEKLDGSNVGDRIGRIASHNDVDSEAIASFEGMPMVDDLQSLSPQAEANCMRDALDDIDTQALHADAAARAWAIGDLASLKANYSDTKLYGCFDQTKTFASARDRVVNETMRAIQESLAEPGKSLIVVSLGYLLRKDGLLDRLNAAGFKVEGPQD